ncbi:MAG: glycerol kinase GlpK [Candidatus Margulisbacteria bacterium]|jgi:glycerol kinase|nr:glycerol kinase GlpK [Candidatus Margulisiibacteriota bacterium]
MKCILAIDQGTTSSRAILYDRSGAQLAAAYEEFPQYFPKPGWVEHDPEEIWQSVRHCIQKVLQARPRARILAIGITNQRETTVLWDKFTGVPLYNAIVWQCRRTADRCASLQRNKSLRHYLSAHTGLTIDPYFSATKLEWLLKNVPGAYYKALKGELLFGTTDSWVLWNLTGGKTHATDYTNASRTMLFNINTLRWDKKLLRVFNIPEQILPQVKNSSGLFGHTTRIGRLPENIPIHGIAGDQQASLFGQTCFEPGTLKNTYGTGGFTLLNTGRKKITSRSGLLTTLCCDALGRPVYALEGSVFSAGASVQWLRDGLKILNSAPESEKLAASLNTNEGVYFVPALTGLGAPHWQSEARGVICGLTRGTTRAHLMRAALEAMAYQTRDVLSAMQKDSGLKISELKADGGAAANNFLCQFQADILGLSVVRPTVIETTSLGAAYLAGLAVGYWKSAEEIRSCWAIDKIFSRTMSARQAGLFYAGWQKAVQRTVL